MYVYIYIYICIYVHVHTCIHTYIHIYVCVCMRMAAYVYVLLIKAQVPKWLVTEKHKYRTTYIHNNIHIQQHTYRTTYIHHHLKCLKHRAMYGVPYCVWEVQHPSTSTKCVHLNIHQWMAYLIVRGRCNIQAQARNVFI